MTDYPPKIDRNFTMGELIAYVTSWGITFGVVAAALRRPSGILGPLSAMLVAGLICFTIALLFRGRKHALICGVVGPIALYLLAFVLAAVIPILVIAWSLFMRFL